MDERLLKRLEDDDARAVDRLQRRRRRLVEPQLRVRLVRADDEVVALGRLRELVVELARRDRAGRVVRVVDPDERDVVVELVEIGEEAVLAPQRQRLHPGSGEERAPLVHRVRRLAERHHAPARCRAPARARRSPPSSRRSARSPRRDRRRRRSAARASRPPPRAARAAPARADTALAPAAPRRAPAGSSGRSARSDRPCRSRSRRRRPQPACAAPPRAA